MLPNFGVLYQIIGLLKIARNRATALKIDKTMPTVKVEKNDDLYKLNLFSLFRAIKLMMKKPLVMAKFLKVFNSSSSVIGCGVPVIIPNRPAIVITTTNGKIKPPKVK